MREYLLTDRNFANDKITIEKIIEQIGTNRDYLYKSVKAASGKSLKAYIYGMRMEEAQKLLDATDKKIEEIAELCGFEIQSTFNRRFKEHFGFTPSDYRNLGKKEKLVGSQ